MKLLFVIQRYGLEISGGAELHCRQLAERLARRHQVTVFATCARDYIHWRNHYPKGWDEINGIRVHRDRVRRSRNLRRFNSISDRVFYEDHGVEDERQWVRENGPFAPALVRRLRRYHHLYDFVIFYCFRYYQTFFGLPLVPAKAVLVPTAEEDPAIRLGIFRRFFNQPRGMIYLTPEEKLLIEDVSGNQRIPGIILGSGFDPVDSVPEIDLRQRFGIEEPYILYVGRIDKNKGCDRLFSYYRRLMLEQEEPPLLILVGTPVLEVPEHPHIRHVGVVDDDEKWALMSAARLLVLPSSYESLSVTVLEAWSLGCPVLVNGQCKVLQGQCLRSNGGLFYHGYAEFASALRLLLDDPGLSRQLGQNGRSYVAENYNWQTLNRKLETLFQHLQKTP